MKTYRKGRGIDPLILNFGTIWRWVANFTPRSLYPWEKEHQYPWKRRLGGPQNWLGPLGKEKNVCPFWELNPKSFSP
jgi:hypothetical protein